MTRRFKQVLRACPLALLIALPALLAFPWVLWSPESAVWWLLASIAGTLLLGVELSRQVNIGGSHRRVWSPELRRAAQRLTTAERLGRLSEQQRTLRSASDPEASKTFQLFTQLVRSEEATHARMAAELHDAVAQSLSRALIELRGGGSAAALDSLADAEEQLRGVMARIRPPELADGNLARAIADLANDLDSRYGVTVAVSWPQESFPLPSVLAITLYRFVQEALTNAVVHADGQDVRLEVTPHGSELHVAVSDGGPGFDPAAVASTEGRHVGLTLARERARLAGGVVHIESSPGRGTRALLRLPL